MAAMIYRQKVLLAVVEAFGGTLSHTDLEKLLFLYCRHVGVNHYDFFPYRYGAFSFMSYYDKQKLIEGELLQDAEQFQLRARKSYISSLNARDRAALRSFFQTMQGIRGRELIRMTYLEYPEFASRSEIADQVLSPEEYQLVSKKWNTDCRSSLFTIGYEGITIDEFLNRLIRNNVNILIDVRMNPFSHKYGFSKNRLHECVTKANMKYIHLPELGIPSHMRQNLKGQKAFENLFDYYAMEILPEQQETLGSIKQALHSNRVALMCFEADHKQCHRHKISERILADMESKIAVVHL